MRRRAIGLLSAAHLFDDLNQGVVPALLPFFISERGFTIAAAAGLAQAPEKLRNHFDSDGLLREPAFFDFGEEHVDIGVGNRRDELIEDAVRSADLVMMLAPDEIHVPGAVVQRVVRGDRDLRQRARFLIR